VTLAERLLGAADWVRAMPMLARLPLGCFAAGTSMLEAVRVPTLLIVTGGNRLGFELNRRARAARPAQPASHRARAR
jgi:hypothetical protein